MTITDPNSYLLDTGDWNHATFICSLGEVFTTYRQVIENAAKEGIGADGAMPLKPILDPNLKKLLDILDEDKESALYLSRRKCRDTSLGGNNAINSLYQYNETDDVQHPFHVAYNDGHGNEGMGRVYSEQIDDLAQIAYFSFGTPIFNNLATFYHSAIDPSLSDLMNKGPTFISAEKIGTLVASGVGGVVSLAALPLVWLNRMVGGVMRTPITKYYDFRAQMPLYYKFVQTILVTIGVNLGYVQNDYAKRAMSGGASAMGSNTNPTETPQSVLEKTGRSQKFQGSPDYISDYTLDIWKILAKRQRYLDGANSKGPPSTDEAVMSLAGTEINTDGSTTADEEGLSAVTWTENMINSFAGGVKKAADDFLSARAGSLYDASTFIGFRIDGNMSLSESFENRTKESETQSKLNSKLAQSNAEVFDKMDGNYSGGGVAQILQSIGGGMKGFVNGLTDRFDLGGLTALATGSGMIDIPKVWDDSSFSQNYSFSLKLRSPYGDPRSILQSIYVPLACILAGGVPRAVGSNSYTSPFLCRVYCKGMISIPLGMIGNIEVSRGNDRHGWSIGRLPTSLDLSFSVTNLTPRCYMALGDSGGLHDAIMGESSNFQEYLATLSGMGLYERLDSYERMQRRTEIWATTLLKNKFNPAAWGTWVGNMPVLKGLVNILPISKISETPD